MPTRSRPRQLPLLALSLLLLLLGISPRALAIAQPSDWAAIDAYVDAQRNGARIPGLALGIVEGGQVVHLQGFGAAGPSGQAVTPQTPFLIGSLSKSFTALAVMQLVEAGQVNLDTPVQSYIPWFCVADETASAQITVRHLLNHTSGIPNAAGLAPLLGDEQTSLEEQVRALSTVRLARPVGSAFEYSNANYIVLGLIVQTASGQPYAEYIQEHIFAPLEMRHSYTSQDEARQHGMAAGYRWWFGFPIAADLPYPASAMPAGYLISSAEDMTRFLAAHLDEGSAVLSPAGLAEMRRSAVATGGNESYGMGWIVSALGDTPVIFHEGSTPNFYATAIMAPEQGRGVIVLTNCTSMFAGQAARIARGVMAMRLGQPIPSASPPFAAFYALVDAAVVLLTAGLVLSVVLLPRWRQRLIERRPRALGFLGRVFLPISWDITWPLVLLVLVPQGAGFPLWRVMGYFQPDLTYWGIGIAVVALGKGVVRIALAVTALRPQRSPQPVKGL